MCGIFSILNNNFIPESFVSSVFKKENSRGPENSKLEKINILCDFGFHRLAINGLNAKSNQPITINNVTLICNGEIYNYKELYQQMNITPQTDSDCEVIIHLFLHYGIEYTLQLLDGVFAFILCDSRINDNDSKLYIARDPYGVRPLYVMKPIITDNQLYIFASEMKAFIDFYSLYKLNKTHQITHFEPGSYSIFSLPMIVSPKWIPIIENKLYHSTGFVSHMLSSFDSLDTIYNNIYSFLSSAVKKRVLNTERPIACLLSGGLDSSLITSLVKTHMNPNTILETYSIGLEGSEDLKYARKVADFLNTKHTEITLTEYDFIQAIPEVIKAIESYDTTTVRASIGNYLLAKYISKNSEAKVIFNGDGSDEVCGGYLYMDYAPNSIEFDKETRRLLKDIHMFDVLRSDKSISSNGLEPRTPFLDRSFVQYYLSIHPKFRFHKDMGKCGKFLLRESFKNKNVLPDDVLWRKKEAFSDGVSHKERSLFDIIQEYVESIDLELFNDTNTSKHNIPKTKEQIYYRCIYDNIYPNTEQLLPYFWMPKWVNATDPSARQLDNYNLPL